ncbi:hypothetical protein BC827DRAFT_245986 [Russula dissimulans]|nr:hypothetical protein BC827DRAFT_245986 [Russula dissimulans]
MIISIYLGFSTVSTQKYASVCTHLSDIGYLFGFTPGPGVESILRAGQAFPRPRNYFQSHDPRARLQDNTNYSASDEKKDNSRVDEDRVDTNRLAISLASACNLGTHAISILPSFREV